MIYGIKRKGNKIDKKKQNYNYTDSEEDNEKVISNVTNIQEPVFPKKPINKNTSIGYSFTEIEVLYYLYI